MLGQAVELFDFVACRRIEFLHFRLSVRPAYIFQLGIAGLFDFQMILEINGR